MRGPVLEFAWRLGLVGLALLGMLLVRAVFLARAARRRRRGLASEPAPALSRGQPTVLLFSGALCGDCIRQKEILADLRTAMGNGWRIREVQAAQEGDLSRRFGVESIPATVVLDAGGRPLAVNYGLVPPGTLQGQLQPALTPRVPIGS